MSRRVAFFSAAVVIGAGIGLGIVLLNSAEDDFGLPLTRHTRHFEIHTDLEPGSLDHYVRVFEGFFDVFDERFFRITQPRPLRMFLFSTQAGYLAFRNQHFPRNSTPYGFFVARLNLIVVNLSSGLGTATHELVHHFCRVSFVRRPPDWVNEGFASFFEKFIGHIDRNGKLQISFGYYSNWRFPDTKSRLDKFSLRRLASFTSADQGAARSLMLFLHRRGLLVKFINRVRLGCRSDCLSELSEVSGMDLDSFERKWKGWIAAQPIDSDVKMVPWAFVTTAEGFEDWWQRNKSWLEWSDEQQRYLPRKTEAADRSGKP
jgi:hypothetical protein